MKRIGLIDIVGVVTLIAGTQLMPSLAGDPGIGWHLASGRWMVENFQVPFTDPFLNAATPKPWVHNQWLTDVAFWLLYQGGGWPLLQLVALGVVIAIFTVVLPKPLLESERGALAIFAALLCGVALVSVQWFLRPVLLSFLLFAVLYRMQLSRHRAEGGGWRGILQTAVLFGVWANLHPGFFMGWLLLGVSGVAVLCNPGAWRERLKRGALLGCEGVCAVLATGVNPYGFSLHRQAFQLLGNKYFMNLNQEWLSPQFELAIFFPVAVVIVGTFLLLCRRKSTPVPRFELFSFLLFFALALESRRYIPFLGVVTVGLFSVLLSAQRTGEERTSEERTSAVRSALRNIERKERQATRYALTLSAWCALLLFTVVTGALPRQEQESAAIDKHFPEKAVQFLSTLEGEPRVFHTPNWGGYLTFKVWPKIKPFIDDRNEVNGQGAYEDFFELALLRPNWEGVLRQHGFNTILLEPNTPLLFMLEHLPGWELVYRDEQALIYCRRGRDPLMNSPEVIVPKGAGAA